MGIRMNKELKYAYVFDCFYKRLDLSNQSVENI